MEMTMEHRQKDERGKVKYLGKKPVSSVTVSTTNLTWHPGYNLALSAMAQPI
jgi:hypothetical protein